MSETTRTSVDFSHRLSANPESLHDCMNPVLERAAAMADLMEAAFELNMANEIHNLWRAAQAIRLEILDAQSILNAYVDGVNVTPKELQSDAAVLPG